MISPLVEEILELKNKKDVLILAHFYEDGEIQDLADHVGDSLFLAQMGQKSDKKTILLCGVTFMAESVKILSPEKTVLVPDLNAGCSLVDSSPYNDYLNWKNKFQNPVVVTYINSSAKVKTISDYICTSSNAVKIIESIPKDKQILFGPDKNLGSYLMKKTGRKMVMWPGSCEVHIQFSAKKVLELKNEFPKAFVLAHPECEPEVLMYADVIGSTSRLLEEVKTNSSTNQFIILTEEGIIHQMKKFKPQATFISPTDDANCGCSQCPYMKLNTLEKIRNTLVNFENEIRVENSIILKAKIPLDRMMDISKN